MKFDFNGFVDTYDTLFRELFFSDDFERYIYFFDRLISVNEIPAGRYKETDNIVSFIAKLVEQPSKASEFYSSQHCDYIFDFYYRYHILIEYLQFVPFIQIASQQKSACFEELFNKTWILGIPSFRHKNF